MSRASHRGPDLSSSPTGHGPWLPSLTTVPVSSSTLSLASPPESNLPIDPPIESIKQNSFGFTRSLAGKMFRSIQVSRAIMTATPTRSQPMYHGTEHSIISPSVTQYRPFRPMSSQSSESDGKEPEAKDDESKKEKIVYRNRLGEEVRTHLITSLWSPILPRAATPSDSTPAQIIFRGQYPPKGYDMLPSGNTGLTRKCRTLAKEANCKIYAAYVRSL